MGYKVLHSALIIVLLGVLLMVAVGVILIFLAVVLFNCIEFIINLVVLTAGVFFMAARVREVLSLVLQNDIVVLVCGVKLSQSIQLIIIL